MQFTPENAAKVMGGAKTQTRRIVHKEDMDFRDQLVNGNVIAVGRLLDFTDDSGRDTRMVYEVGKDYAVCPGRGKKALGRVRITAIREENIQDISNADASAELGYALGSLGDAISYQAFSELWQSLYKGQRGKQWEDNPEVWVLTLEVVKP